MRLRMPRACLVALSLSFWATPGAAAQELRLDALPEGPKLRAENAATDLAARLEAEQSELAALAGRSSGEGRSAAAAKARIRTVAAYLLRSGAGRPWTESAPAVLGARLSLVIGRIDAMVDLAAKGRGALDRPLPQSDAARAIRLLDAIGATSIDPLRRASIAGPDALAAATVEALRTTLVPLIELLDLVETAQPVAPWPALGIRPDGGRDREGKAVESGRAARHADPAISADSLEGEIDALPGGDARDALHEALRAMKSADGGFSAVEARRLAVAARAVRWLDSIRGEVPPLRVPARVVDSALERIAASVRSIAGGAEGASLAGAALESLGPCVAAGEAMAALRCMKDLPEAAKQDLADAVAGLFSADAADAAVERARGRTAERIAEACARANRLVEPPGAASGSTSTAPAAPALRDLKDAIRQFDRDSRAAVRALPRAIRDAAAAPDSASDPARLSGFERLRTLEEDRARLESLQRVIDSISAVRPAAGRSFAAVARRLARMLLDPIKRSDAQLAFSALEAQCAQAFPFPYEEQLRRRSPRALELSDRSPELMLERIDRIRTAWCEAIGRGDFGGPESQRLDEAARLCRALADLDQVVEPIDRAASDRLFLWGGWATRRALAAPASQDLVARTNLAVRSFVAVRSPETQTAFERDLFALEQAIPVVRFAAAIERSIGPVLQGDPDSVGAQLAPILATPDAAAFLATSWDRLLMLHRAMIESEFSRRTSDGAQSRALDAFMAALANDLDARAFGPRRAVGRIPGFDGSQRNDDGGGRGDRKSGDGLR